MEKNTDRNVMGSPSMMVHAFNPRIEVGGGRGMESLRSPCVANSKLLSQRKFIYQGLVWWNIPNITVIRRWRQENPELKAILSYASSSRLVYARLDESLSQKIHPTYFSVYIHK